MKGSNTGGGAEIGWDTSFRAPDQDHYILINRFKSVRSRGLQAQQ